MIKITAGRVLGQLSPGSATASRFCLSWNRGSKPVEGHGVRSGLVTDQTVCKEIKQIYYKTITYLYLVGCFSIFLSVLLPNTEAREYTP